MNMLLRLTLFLSITIALVNCQGFSLFLQCTSCYTPRPCGGCPQTTNLPPCPSICPAPTTPPPCLPCQPQTFPTLPPTPPPSPIQCLVCFQPQSCCAPPTTTRPNCPSACGITPAPCIPCQPQTFPTLPPTIATCAPCFQPQPCSSCNPTTHPPAPCPSNCPRPVQPLPCNACSNNNNQLGFFSWFNNLLGGHYKK